MLYFEEYCRNLRALDDGFSSYLVLLFFLPMTFMAEAKGKWALTFSALVPANTKKLRKMHVF